MQSRLERACAELDALAKDIEERFLACGRSMQAQVGLTSALIEQSRQLTEISSRMDEGKAAVRRIGAVVGEHLSLSEDYSRQIERLAGTLEAHAGNLNGLLGDQSQLERSVAPMGVLHSFFLIESATLPEEIRGLFHAVTAEMKRLHTDVSRSFEEHERSITGTRDGAVATARQLRRQAAGNAELTRRKREEVRSSLERLEAELQKTRARNGQLAAAIGDIDRQTDAITVSIQYQDITRQKMDHVREAAHDLLAAGARAGMSFDRRLRYQEVLCRVQATQLDAVEQEIGRAAASLTEGLQAVLGRIRSIESDCLSVGAIERVTADTDAVTREMEATLQVSSELMRSSVEGLEHAIRTARGISETTTGATDTMRRLADDLRLIGLNAQVQAVHANNGSLEVLSSAASAISSEAGARTLDFEHKLTATTGDLKKLVQRSEAYHAEAVVRRDALRAQEEEILQDLRRESEAGKALVAETGSLLGRLKEQADELLASIDLAAFSREAIGRTRAVFAEMAGLCAAAHALDASEDQALLAEVQDRYTMHSERAAHADAVSASDKAAAAEPTPEAAEPAAAGSPALGDNVELF